MAEEKVEEPTAPIVKIKFVRGKGYELKIPVIEAGAPVDGDKDNPEVLILVTEATSKTLENVLKIRRLHGAAEISLPVGATHGTMKK